MTLGTINGVILCTVWENGRVVAECADTPNARAYAYFKHPKASSTQSHYPGWSPVVRFKCEESANRIVHRGWIDNNIDARYRSL